MAGHIGRIVNNQLVFSSRNIFLHRIQTINNYSITVEVEIEMNYEGTIKFKIRLKINNRHIEDKFGRHRYYKNMTSDVPFNRARLSINFLSQVPSTVMSRTTKKLGDELNETYEYDGIRGLK